MRNIRKTSTWILAACFSGIMLGTCFPNPDFAFIAWVALVPILWLSAKQDAGVFGLSWTASFIGFSINLAWVRHTMIDYGGIPWALAFVFLGLLAAYCAVFQATALFCAFRVQKLLPMAWILVPGAFWVAFEYLRTHLFSGFPWNSLGLSQHSIPYLLQNARWGSFYGLSFLIVMVNTFIAMLISDGFRQLFSKQGLIVIGLISSAILYGKFTFDFEPASIETIRVGLIQPNIAQEFKWEEAKRDDSLNQLLRLSESLRPNAPELIVWPESSITYLFRFAARYHDQEGMSYADKIRILTHSMNASLLTGTLDQLGSDTFNAAVLAPLSGLESYYYKEHLVPFGEYIPLPKLFFFVNRLVQESIGTFAVGTSSEPLVADTARIGMMICYEGVFPDLVRRRVASGANILCNITNDSWFGRSWAPEQHFSAYRFRAVENARWVIRAANTGISGAIDSRGRIMTQSKLFAPEALIVNVPLMDELTFYSQFGDVFALSCVIFCLMIATILAVSKNFK